MTPELKAFADSLIVTVKGYVDRVTGGINERVDQIAKRIELIPAGPRGEIGERGEKGLDGAPGRDGRDGADGKQGGEGPKGDKGDRGEKGDPGERGERGLPGDKGADGINGKDGVSGRDGTDGKDGQHGKDGAPGRDGKDADPEMVAALVAQGIERALPAAVQKAIDAIMPELIAKAAQQVPKPRDGLDGKDGAPGKDGAEGRPGESGKDGAPGRDGMHGKDGINGKDADEAALEARLMEKIAREVSAIPVPKDGRDGRDAPIPDVTAVAAKLLPMMPKPRDGIDGKDAEPVDTQAIVEAVVKRIPVPKDGARGQDGKSVTFEELRPVVDDLFAKAVPEWLARVDNAIKALPVPKDGQSVTVEDLRPLLEAKQSEWALDFERRAQETLQRAIDKMPAPKDGRDALSVEDFSVSLDGRTFKFALACGDRVVERSIKVPFPVYRGIYVSGQKSEEGDVWTFGGSLWIAKKDTDTKPPSDDWRLMVQRGRDGKDAKPE